MRVNSHLQKIKEQVIDALSSDKEQLIKKYSIILNNSNKLLKTTEFDFWRNQIIRYKWDAIPVTKIGVSNELIVWKNFKPTLKNLYFQLQKTSENILSFWEVDDLCEMQGQFYYYKDENSNQIYKESEFGSLSCISKGENLKIIIASIEDLQSSKIINKDNQDVLFH